MAPPSSCSSFTCAPGGKLHNALYYVKVGGQTLLYYPFCTITHVCVEKHCYNIITKCANDTTTRWEELQTLTGQALLIQFRFSSELNCILKGIFWMEHNPDGQNIIKHSVEEWQPYLAEHCHTNTQHQINVINNDLYN